MGAEAREPAAGLIERLLAEPQRFSFFQLVQLLERRVPRAARIGREGPAGREALRLRPALSLEFPSSDVAAVARAEDEYGRERWTVETTFLGLYGTDSPLPNYVTEDLLHEDAEAGSLVRGVLDLFHHRMLSLFWRAWAKYRVHAESRPDGTDPVTARLLMLAGLVTGPEERVGGAEDAVPKLLMLRYAGLLARRPCSAAALAGALSDFFGGLPVHVTACVPRHVRVPDEGRTRLGVTGATLGVDTIAGSRVPDRSGRYRIGVGPLGLDDFELFLPGGARRAALDRLAGQFAGDALEHELELVLKHDEIPPLALDGTALRLGQTTWLGRPAGDGAVVFAPRA